MKAYPTASLIHHFSHIEDPRINRHKSIAYLIFSSSPFVPLFVVLITGWLLKPLAKPNESGLFNCSI
jgi:hypothetical protein